MTTNPKRKPNFGSPVFDALNEESVKKNKEQRNFGMMSTGHKESAEIILNLKTARLLQAILLNKWGVNYKTREHFENCLSDHIEACSQ